MTRELTKAPINLELRRSEMHRTPIKIEYAGIGLILLCLAAALLYEVKHTGLTVDEPSHFAAGYMYWLGDDVLIPADTPPLTRIVSGWVPRAMGAPDPRKSKHWESRDAYLIGSDILGDRANHGRRVLFFSRLPFLIFPLGIVFLIWHWGRQLFSEGTAMILACCGALEPTILSHGALIKSDVPSAFFSLLFTYSAWTFWNSPRASRLLLMTAAIVAAVLTKFTLLPLLFVGYALALWRGPRLLAALIIPLSTYFGILAAGQFHAHAIPAERLAAIIGNGAPSWFLRFASLPAQLPWPTQFVDAFSYTIGNLRGDGFTGYMLGHMIHGWTPLYFPLAWAVKFPIALQLLTIAGLAAFGLRTWKRQWEPAQVAIWCSGLFYFGLAIASNFHIGFRHLLPALPFLILGGGYTIDRYKSSRTGRAVTIIGFAWLSIATINQFPQCLTYFNEWIGGPRNGWKVLADSNIDWGQNYPELAAYMNRAGIKNVRAFLFSFDNPWHYMPEGTLSFEQWPANDLPKEARFHPTAGTYAISANILTGLLFPPGNEKYLEAFQTRTPTGYAGYSILIFKVE
jgi:hypothetical protein